MTRLAAWNAHTSTTSWDYTASLVDGDALLDRIGVHDPAMAARTLNLELHAALASFSTRTPMGVPRLRAHFIGSKHWMSPDG